MEDIALETGISNDVATATSIKDTFDLSFLRPVYVLPTHLSVEEAHSAEDDLCQRRAPLTYDIKEANVVIANISQPRRAKSELQWKGVILEDLIETPASRRTLTDSESDNEVVPAAKCVRLDSSSGSSKACQKVDSSSTASDSDGACISPQKIRPASLSAIPQSHDLSPITSAEIYNKGVAKVHSYDKINTSAFQTLCKDERVLVINIEWLKESIKANQCLAIEPWIVYKAHLVPQKAHKGRPKISVTAISKTHSQSEAPAIKITNVEDVSQHANAEAKVVTSKYRKRDRIKHAADPDIVGRSFSSSAHSSTKVSNRPITRPTQLLHETTSEYDEAVGGSVPSMPNWVLQNKVYSCERCTPLNPPNEDFICQLKKIRAARVLTLDEIGVRAYSTSIASLAAYPHPIQTAREILALPGCDHKIAQLFREYQQNRGQLQAVHDLEADPALKVLRSFFEIWGVGAVTAREFYYDKGWRDLDDIIELGWKSLSRVQQIGLKYYDEFQKKLSRSEVEGIAARIAKHAKRVTDPGIETVIVGSYRRGKSESGDVDVILSHQDNAVTYDLVNKVVKSLEREGWITHTLTLNLTNTKRNQEPLPINTATVGGHGFDTLDKALLIWQDPNWPSKTADLAADPKASNPNPHRRVDIIISPWRTVGCAVAGWTSGTTFQRDLRRYAKHVKGWKFDSSGVRERGTGKWVDLEEWSNEETRCKSWQEAERRVFKNFGLEYREPWERCTG